MERNSLTLFVFHFLNDLPNWSDETNDKECKLNDFFFFFQRWHRANSDALLHRFLNSEVMERYKTAVS